MKTSGRSLFTFLLLLTLGCAPQTRYAWNGYDEKLHEHYKNPAQYDQFVEHLKEVIAEGEASGKMPPGIYAEYGFALYEKGNFPEAIKYFSLESERWPESRVLMSKMISNAEMQGKRGKKSQEPSASPKVEIAAPKISDAKETSK